MNTTFTHAGRTWVAIRCLTEDETREYVRVTPAGPPLPTKDEYRAARAAYFARQELP